MSNKVFSIETYAFKPEDRFIFDANIWLYLFAPPSASGNYAARKYSEAFKSILRVKAGVFVTSLVLSEYINRYCRIEWSALHKDDFPDFKKFRNSDRYLSVGDNSSRFADEILGFSSRLDDGFSKVDIGEILAFSARGVMDFNDGLIIRACKENDCKLITHDGDFVEGNINVVTANNRLVVACA